MGFRVWGKDARKGADGDGSKDLRRRDDETKYRRVRYAGVHHHRHHHHHDKHPLRRLQHDVRYGRRSSRNSYGRQNQSSRRGQPRSSWLLGVSGVWFRGFWWVG